MHSPLFVVTESNWNGLISLETAMKSRVSGPLRCTSIVPDMNCFVLFPFALKEYSTFSCVFISQVKRTEPGGGGGGGRRQTDTHTDTHTHRDRQTDRQAEYILSQPRSLS